MPPPLLTVPGWIDEVDAKYVTAAIDDVAIILALAGSSEDPEHVRGAVRVIEKLASKRQGTVKLLAVLAAAGTSGPPAEAVRNAIAQAAPRVKPKLDSVAVVIGGDGFAGAIHRAVLGGILLVTRTTISVRVVADVPMAIDTLVERSPDSRARVLRFYEERVRAPSVLPSSPSAHPASR